VEEKHWSVSISCPVYLAKSLKLFRSKDHFFIANKFLAASLQLNSMPYLKKVYWDNLPRSQTANVNRVIPGGLLLFLSVCSSL